ncbi:sodium/proton antiporter, NhaD family [Capnocytophaga haemolytica]|uniref:Na+/H+ antiporter, NhaD family n=1 Tax=Capnocytophaga haemolytica TaxID=45243 RepID=A0AAX2GWT4_9FLAO|nr:sodium:proton antiporter NhaD [Capnocytophaga haemolytica]AMD84784.1 sodium:proton antiporter [Capnocytophaga haemolytica]SFN74172.1 sodium/proton antiporter, NhaD family [Capnocytophaga haemolytica]SNV07417.1 Na+/H+ antiporter, NhaD family [Capnocytophaga haemolytica]
METWIIVVFFIGYLFITIEHQVRIDKTISALAMAVVCWTLLKTLNLTVVALSPAKGLVAVNPMDNPTVIDQALLHHLGTIAEILFFLIGAMTIVEIIDMHRGFELIKQAIKTRQKVKLLWIIGLIAFFLSPLIDNLTTTIILITIVRKLIPSQAERYWYASLIVIAANAGGSWSPIGDVTTTMLWIGNKVSAAKLIEYVFLPSVVCFAVPMLIASFLPPFRGNIEVSTQQERNAYKSSLPVLLVGFVSIIGVPIFKSTVHLPPYMGMLFALALMWFISEKLKPIKELSTEESVLFSTHRALSKIEFSSILFFLGILLAVAALESIGVLFHFAESLNSAIPNENLVVFLLGCASAVIDNVPLVAASIGMFQEPLDAPLWHEIAYAAGTGGSLLIIGSAAGVAAMGMERISFFWYAKNILWMALLGFAVGFLSLIGMEHFSF